MHEIWQTYLVVALVAYLLGSIPFGYILVKLFLQQDIRQTGSGNIGATNVARSGKKGLAIATLLLDAAKGYFAVMFALYVAQHALSILNPNRLFVPPEIDSLPFFAALVAVLGHVFPIWLRFRGGKGVATAVGAFFPLSPLGVLISIGVFATSFVISRYVSLSSILATAIFPFISPSSFRSGLRLIDGSNWIGRMWLLDVVFIFAASAVVILKHHANIRRLLNGTEPKFTTKKTPPSPVQVEKNA